MRMRIVRTIPLAILALSTTGCGIKKVAINKLGDALASPGTTFSADNDPEFVRDAVPFSLKLMESLLAESPRHRGLQNRPRDHRRSAHRGSAHRSRPGAG